MRIRAASRADVPAVLELWRAAYERARPRDTTAAVERLIDHDPAALIVAERDGAVAGTLIAAWDGWRGAMYRLAVHPDARGAGVARELIRRGEARLRDLGAERISALVSRADGRAVAVWEAAGYRADEPTGRWVRDL